MRADRPGIAVQLWSVRGELEQDPDGVLAALSDIGFEGVETAFYDPATDLQAMGGRFRDHGLTVAAAHVELPVTAAGREHVIRQADAFGVDLFLSGSRDEKRHHHPGGVDAIVDELSAACAWATSQGLRFGIHNHWWELERATDGRLIWAEIFDRLPPEFVVEPDCYWAAMVGVTVEEFVEASQARAPVFHVKDGPARNSVDPMTTLGEGRVDLDEALAAGKGADWWVAELSHCSGDMLEALAAGYRYLERARREA